MRQAPDLTLLPTFSIIRGIIILKGSVTLENLEIPSGIFALILCSFYLFFGVFFSGGNRADRKQQTAAQEYRPHG